MEIKFDKVTFVINKNTPLEKTILNDVSFNISECGIYSFIGSSNSGKTAIGDLINSLVKPTKGKISFTKNGRRITSINKIRFETGYV